MSMRSVDWWGYQRKGNHAQNNADFNPHFSSWCFCLGLVVGFTLERLLL